MAIRHYFDEKMSDCLFFRLKLTFRLSFQKFLGSGVEYNFDILKHLHIKKEIGILLNILNR